ncbi:N-acetylmuramoyl-L-alanine amidase [candidate division KSB1 bacterium]
MKQINHIRKILTAAAVILFTMPVHTAAQTIQVDVKGVPERTAYLSGIFNGGDYYVSSTELAEILDLNTYYDPQLAKIVLYFDGTQVTFTPDNPFVMIASNLFQMPLEVREYRSEIYIPIGELAPLLNRMLPGQYSFDRDERILEIYPGGAINITGITVEEKENGSLIRIAATREFGPDLSSWFDDVKSHLTMTFYRGRLDTLQLTNTDTRGLILRTTAFQFPESAQITFRLSAYTESYHVDTDPANGDILISLMRRGAGAEEVRQPVDPSRFETEEVVAREKESWEFDTIIIDPGHGGKDPGTLADGLMEKDIVLDIALHLRKLLEQSELFESVVMTRENDLFVPLMERAEIAKVMNGKLFVSIHVNSNKNTRLRGFETYFLRPGRNDDALEILEVVQRENNVMQLYEDVDPERELTDEDKMVLAMTQSAFVKESELFAQYINEGISRKINWPNRGVKQAGFLVLWRVPMPNVLIETGFISNSNQRRDLKTRSVRYRIAEGIFEGIRRFKEDIRR